MDLLVPAGIDISAAATAPAQGVSQSDQSAELLRELKCAHQIIRNGLKIMSISQKLAWAKMNARDDVDGDGITRAHERKAVIDRASRGAS